MTDHLSEDSLRCALGDAVNAWVDKHAPRRDGQPVIDIAEAIAALSDTGIGLIRTLTEPKKQTEAISFFHRCLDASVEAWRTGTHIDVPTKEASQ